MQGNIHAVLLLLLPLATIAAIAKAKRSPTRVRFLAAMLIGLLLINAILMVRSSREAGEPVRQAAIGGICLFFALAYVRPAAIRRLLAAGVLVGTLALSCHFYYLVGQPGWTGNPRLMDEISSRILKMLRDQAEKSARRLPERDVVYPAGWLRDLPIGTDERASFAHAAPKGWCVRRAWHTWLTGLYTYTTIPQDYWYPGGSLAETVQKIELRERPAP